ncbi:hypothetical protein B0F90DRAFT_1836880 [Multifurca ochricompacta]|uniref:DNA polymerase n=1 Tax=Multifurca ochricompacta TaxID=376703 RepID=A0AAD4M587_9AGAM|nr:hypothetical protein B0F90DRAFT_1836880 [Multifurca ochricompacta]
MRKRLERHLDWNLAKRKALVTPEWLRDSVAQDHLLPCADYAALPDLKEAAEKHCPRSTSQSIQTPSYKPSSPFPSPHTSFIESPFRTAHVNPGPPAFLLPPPVPLLTPKLDHTARFSCSRASPLISVNQSLCSAFDVLRCSRVLEGNERSALSYARAIARVSLTVNSAFPRKITASERSEVQKLPFIGAKISKMIDEYLFYGEIAEIEEKRKSERFVSLSLFASIYGIGPVTARKLYDRGLRTLRDLEAYYEADIGPAPIGQSDSTEMNIRIALELRDDLVQTISRDEVEAIHSTILDHLNAVEPGCVSTLVGGYRRGKPASNDIDIVFTHPNTTSAKGLCTRLIARLRSSGLVTHVMHLSSFHEYNTLRTAHWDSLEKALTVYRTPNDGQHRRVDLICALPDTYWTAVVGWTGGTTFERDLRSAAKAIGLKFDSSGITRRRDSKIIYPRSEKEVFDIIGLPWVDPTLRNTDA